MSTLLDHQPFASLRAFILWRLEPGEPKRKIPLHADGVTWHSDKDPAPSMSAGEAAERLAALRAQGVGHDRPGEVGYLGIGFRPSGTGLACLDVDSCIKEGQWTAGAPEAFRRFPGALVEQSSGGHGVHVWFSYEGESLGRHGRDPSGQFELYAEGQFLALGRTVLSGTVADHTAAARAMLAEKWPAQAAATVPAEWTDSPADGWANPRTDAEVLAKCADPAYRPSAAQMFDGKESLCDLWNGDASSFEGRRSEARMSLLSQLMTLCGGNCEQVYRLTQDHPLAVKDGRENLLRAEILKACGNFMAWWEPERARRDAQRAATARIGEQVGEQVLAPALTLDEMLANLVYVAHTSEVVDRRTGRIRPFDAARREFAASRHKWIDDKGKAHDVPALQLWLAHPLRLTVDVATWAPDRTEFCSPPETINGNTRAINTWRGFKPMQAPANWREWSEPWVRHIEYLIPDEAQRGRFVQWLAHVRQCPGVLPHTCYLMIAKETGIGRNWVSAVLARVFAGYVAAGVSLAPILDGQFNGRLSQKLFATVDETREGMTEHRHARGEALKRTITEEERLINTKYGRQVVEFNCCRWLMFSNHDDALPFDNNDRRVIVIENPTDRKAPEYFTYLYGLLGYPEFIASVGEHLRMVDLAGFNPGAPAPMSAAKQRALNAMTSGIDKAVQEFKATWPGLIAGRSDVRSYIVEATGEAPKDSALSHALERAGYTQWPRRLRFGLVRDRAIALQFTVDELDALGAERVAHAIEEARTAFAGSPGFETLAPMPGEIARPGVLQ